MAIENLQVAASADDAGEATNGNTYITADSFGITVANIYYGARWTVPNVAQGATISAATLSIYLPWTVHDDPHFDVYFEDVDNPSAFSAGTGNHDVSGRTKTTAVTNVNATNVGAGFYGITVTSLVQEIVDRGGWAAGQHMVALLQSVATVDCTIRCWDYDVHAQGAKLDVTYTNPAGGVAGALVNSIPLRSLVHGGLVR